MTFNMESQKTNGVRSFLVSSHRLPSRSVFLISKLIHITSGNLSSIHVYLINLLLVLR